MPGRDCVVSLLIVLKGLMVGPWDGFVREYGRWFRCSGDGERGGARVAEGSGVSGDGGLLRSSDVEERRASGEGERYGLSGGEGRGVSGEGERYGNVALNVLITARGRSGRSSSGSGLDGIEAS